MMIYLGADHAGFHYKEHLKTILTNLGYRFEDLGNDTLKPRDDYPDFARLVAQAVSNDSGSRGVLICDSGAGMAIVANRFKGVRAVCANSNKEARHARTDNDANVLCLGSEYLPRWRLKSVIRTWLTTPASTAKRHRRRLKKIDQI